MNPLLRFQQRHLDGLRRSYAAGRKFVLIMRRRHDTTYRDASTIDHLFKACLEELTANRDEYHYYDLPESIPEPVISQETIASLPPGPVRNVASNLWEVFHKQEGWRRDSEELRENVDRAIAEHSGVDAYFLLKTRSENGNDYESIDLEPFH
jgi:hypothetical protein